jgi:AmmeMemoRadiSam system protein B
MPRKPVVAGQFYEGSSRELDKQITDCFSSKFGPGALPLKKRTKKILGIISPHAGYQFSGPCAAWAYKELAESKLPDLFILLGLSHAGHPSCISLEDWETPFGLVKNDIEFGNALIKNSNLKQNESAHQHEHSIEVQLPFLQFINKESRDKLKISPIIASPDIKYEDLAKSIATTIKSQNKRTIIIASSDFTHFGLNYGYFPFSKDVKDNMYQLDNKAIEHIKSLNAYRFLDYIEETGATICGKYPIAVLIEICKLLGAKKARLMHYYTSGDIIGDYGSAVGYGAISVE